MKYDSLLGVSPYALPKYQKDALLKEVLAEALLHHYESSAPFRALCIRRGFLPPFASFFYEEIPFFPVGIFKELELLSVPKEHIVQTLRSSATSSQSPSIVCLDEITRMRQVRTLTWLLSDILGTRRRPFLVFDAFSAQGGRDTADIAARSAALRGFLIGASSVHFCMRENGSGGLTLDEQEVRRAEEKVNMSDIFPVVLGYTYILYHSVARSLRVSGDVIRLPPQTTLLHFGGWKKLQDEAVGKARFNQEISSAFGISEENIIDIFGFTEQLGVIYGDGSDGMKRCPLVSEVIVRDPVTLDPVPDGEAGLLEFITPLPLSYPGIAVLLDDMGRIISRAPAQDGRCGTAFEVIGRARASELRGCGDVLSEIVAEKTTGVS